MMYDPDAPTGSGWWHWADCNIPASTMSLPADAGNPDAGLLPPGAVTVANELRLARFLGAAPALLGFVLRDHLIGRAVLMGLQSTD